VGPHGPGPGHGLIGWREYVVEVTDLLDRLEAALGNRYTIERELGQGGMATVFLAADRKHERKVAIKVFRPDLSRDAGEDRFLVEIATTANLRHPHILPLYDSGVAAGLWYYVMPYAEGETLKDRLRREGPLPVDEALRIAKQVGSALAYAHSRGVIHRDVKPENILLEHDHAVVADFGIAKAMDSAKELDLTKDGITVGTPTYISPEMVTGKTPPDGRADMYALGCILHEMLTGRPPFTGESVDAVIRKHLAEAPTPIRKIRPTVPEDIENIVLRSLAKNPADRFATDEFVAVLTTSESGTIQIPKMGPPRWVVPSIAGAGVVLAALAAWLLFRTTADPIPTVESRTQLTLDETLDVDPALSPDGEMVAYAAGNRGAMQIYVRQVAGERAIPLSDDLTRNHRWPRWTPDGQSITYEVDGHILLVPALGGTAQPLFPKALDDSVGGLAWSPDGAQVAFVRTTAIYLRNLETGEERQLAEVSEPYSLSWSPDGAHIAFVSGNRQGMFASYYLGNSAPSAIQLASVATGEVTTLLPADAPNLSPVWSPDGRYLFVISGRGGGRDLFRVAIKDGQAAGVPERVTTGLEADAVGLSADGLRMVYARRATTSNLWWMPLPAPGSPAASARDAERLTQGSQRIESVALSPDGEWLAFDSDRAGNFDIYVSPVSGGDPRPITTHGADDFNPSWSPDGQWIGFHSFRNGNRDLFIASADGSVVRPLSDAATHEMGATWSPDQSEIAFARSEWEGVFRMPVTDEPNESFVTVLARACCPEWSAASDRIAALQLAPATDLQRVVTMRPDGSELRVIDQSDPETGHAVIGQGNWGPDGRWVYYLTASPEGARLFRADDTTGRRELAVAFTDPERQPVLWNVTIGRDRLIVELGDHESDIWIMDLEYR
jgi:serine/threonine-protein kinase